MIKWLKSIFFSHEFERLKILEKRALDIEEKSIEIQTLVNRQSELVAAIAAIQCELIASFAESTMPGKKIRKDEQELMNEFLDDDEFIN